MKTIFFLPQSKDLAFYRHKKFINGFSQRLVVMMFLMQCAYLQPVRNMNVHHAIQEWIIITALLANFVPVICIQMDELVVNDVHLTQLQIMVTKFYIGQKC